MTGYACHDLISRIVELDKKIKRGVEMAHAGKVVRHEPGHFSALAAQLEEEDSSR